MTRLVDTTLRLVRALIVALILVSIAAAAAAKTRAYVFNDGSGDISIIDTETHEVIVTVDVGLRIRWFSSRFFDGKRVWGVDADRSKAEAIVFDPWKLKELKRIPFGKGPSMSVELSPDLAFAAANAAGSDQIAVIDTRTYEVVRRIPVGDFPCDLTFSNDGEVAYEPDRDQDTVTVLDWQAGRTVKTIALESGSKPWMITLSPDGRHLWVQERDSARVSVFDTTTFRRVARLKVGRTPVTNEFTPSGRYSIVNHIGENYVKVFDTATLSEVKTIVVGRSPVNVAIDAEGKFAYVTNWGSHTVSVIDLAEWQVVKTIKVGRHPFGIYLFDPSTGIMTGNRSHQ